MSHLQVSLPPSQAHRYCNLVRWFDYMQNTADATSVFPKVDFEKPNLPGPPPTPPLQGKVDSLWGQGTPMSVPSSMLP